VLGIDIFQPALDLAADNVAGSEVAERVELNRLDVYDLPAEPAFGVA
jgi:23S rRNA G2445 N2-methylase RlmL